MKIKCVDCYRIITVNQETWKSSHKNNILGEAISPTCKECNGDLEIMEEDNNVKYYKEESENEEICIRCNKKIKSFDSDANYECQECSDSPLCEKCMLYFLESEISLCKKCIDERYISQHRNNTQEKVVYIDKIIEKPIIKYIDKNGEEVEGNRYLNIFAKTRFD